MLNHHFRQFKIHNNESNKETTVFQHVNIADNKQTKINYPHFSIATLAHNAKIAIKIDQSFSMLAESFFFYSPSPLLFLKY